MRNSYLTGSYDSTEDDNHLTGVTDQFENFFVPSQALRSPSGESRLHGGMGIFLPCFFMFK